MIPALANIETLLESISHNKEFLTLTGILTLAIFLTLREVYLHLHDKEEGEKLARTEDEGLERGERGR